MLIFSLLASGTTLARRSAAKRKTQSATQPTKQAQRAPRPTATPDPNDAIGRIKDEGLNRSHVVDTLSYLSDVIGPRLTGSPNMKRAKLWMRDQLAKG